MIFIAALQAGGCARNPVARGNLDQQLLLAAQRGDNPAVERLPKKGTHLEARDQGGLTALALAAEFGHADTVKLLLQRGADIVAGK